MIFQAIIRKLKYVVFCIFITQTATGQTLLKGEVRNVKGEILPYASVLLKNKTSGYIESFVLTDEYGQFVLPIPITADSLSLIATFLGYGNDTLPYSSNLTQVSFQLEENIRQLEQVIVSTPKPIKKVGDTLIYDMESFQNIATQNLSEVLEKLPGVEVDKEGRIKYQGMPINKFYVESLDLMEGRYNVISKNLPAEAVSEIQILENHQPIQILDSLYRPPNAALNIVLKSGHTFTGEARMGFGGWPIDGEVAITPMLFNKKYQMVASTQANSSGIDLLNQTTRLTISEIIGKQDDVQPLADWELPLQGTPGLLPTKYWLDNRSVLVTPNLLLKNKNNLQIKWLMEGLSEQTSLQSFSRTRYQLPDQTLEQTEDLTSKVLRQNFSLRLILEKNIKSHYFKNEWETYRNSDLPKYDILLNNTRWHQSSIGTTWSTTNRTKWVKPVRKGMLHYTSSINHSAAKKELNSTANLFDLFLSDSEKLYQQIHQQRVFTHQKLAYHYNWKGIWLLPKVGYKAQWVELDTELKQKDHVSEAGSFINKLDSYSQAIDFEYGLKYSKKKVNIELKPKIVHNRFSFLSVSKNFSVRTLFLPSLNASYSISQSLKSSLTIGREYYQGRVETLPEQFILRNYRFLFSNTQSTIVQEGTTTATAFLTLEKWSLGLFGHIDYSQRRGQTNLGAGHNLDSAGVNSSGNISQKTPLNEQILDARLSKTIPILKSSAAVNFNYFESKTSQFFMGIYSSSTFSTYSFTTTWALRPVIILDISFQNRIIGNEVRIDQNISRNPILVQNQANVNFFVTRKNLLSLELYHIQTGWEEKKVENQMINLLYRYTGKDRMVFEIQGRNLTGEKSNQYQTVEQYYSQSLHYTIRSRQIFVFLRFSF